MTETAARRARIRRASPTDREVLADFLGRLSPESAYLRFLTVVTGRSETLLTSLLPDDAHGGALLAFVDAELVGHAMWGLRAPGIADLGVVVLDGHQRAGVGTALARALMVELSARGIEEAEVYSSAGNRAVARMVARQAPGAHHELDGPMLTFRFHTAATSAATAGAGAGHSSPLPRTA